MITTGYVQRTKVNGPTDSYTLCAWIGSESSEAEIFFVAISASDSSVEVEKKQAMIANVLDAYKTRRSIGVIHSSSDAEIQGFILG